MGRQPDDGSGAGEEPAGGPGAPGDRAPDPGLAGFAAGGVWDSAVPSAALAVALAGAAGEGWRCEVGSRGEAVGAVRAAAALESFFCSAKLGLIRAAIRADDDGLGGDCHGDLPDEWSKSLTAEIALALSMSPVSAGNLMQTAWDLGVLLPKIGALLQDGTLTYPKARAVNDALELLSEPDKTRAEAMIAEHLAGKTFGQVEGLAARAAITVDPGLAGRAREHAERNRATVILRRERSGAAGLSGCDAGGGDPGGARGGVRPGAGVQGLGGVPGGADGPVPGDGLPRPDERRQRRRADRGRPAQGRPGRPGRVRVPRRPGAGRPRPARPGAQRRLGLPVRPVRRRVRAPRRQRRPRQRRARRRP